MRRAVLLAVAIVAGVLRDPIDSLARLLGILEHEIKELRLGAS